MTNEQTATPTEGGMTMLQFKTIRGVTAGELKLTWGHTLRAINAHLDAKTPGAKLCTGSMSFYREPYYRFADKIGVKFVVSYGPHRKKTISQVLPDGTSCQVERDKPLKVEYGDGYCCVAKQDR
jgi:hypothetical protein